MAVTHLPPTWEGQLLDSRFRGNDELCKDLQCGLETIFLVGRVDGKIYAQAMAPMVLRPSRLAHHPRGEQTTGLWALFSSPAQPASSGVMSSRRCWRVEIGWSV